MRRMLRCRIARYSIRRFLKFVSRGYSQHSTDHIENAFHSISIALLAAVSIAIMANDCSAQVVVVTSTSGHADTLVVDGPAQMRDTLRFLSLDAQSRGHLSFRRDSTVIGKDTTFVYHHYGPVFQSNINRVGKRGRPGELIPANETNIRAAARTLLQPYENSGYPFAEVLFTAWVAEDSVLAFEPKVNPGRFIVYDSLVIDAERGFSQTYFEQCLGIRPGRPYNERNLLRIERTISELSFVRLLAPPSAVFKEERADVYLRLADVRANRFDGIVGLQPDLETGRPVITGDLSLYLENAFRRGEIIDFQWRRLQEQTQNLRVNTQLPYLLNTRIGVWGGVELYRRDSTFTTSEVNASIGYLLGADRYLRTFAERWTSNALRDGISSVDNVIVRRYGIAWQGFRLDNRMNPMKGYQFNGELAAGLKTLFTPDLAQTESEHNQFSGELKLSGWLPLSGRLSLIPRLSGGFKADSTLRLNEFYRIGGLNSIRGFDEEQFFASSYGIATLELKFLLDRTSAFFAFIDQGWYERIDERYFNDTPTGFGIGALVGTENSTFRIYYALGSEQGNPILVRNGRVHFGFINRF